MEYFYTPPHLIGGDHLAIEGEEFSHLTHVMRKGIGDVLLVVDGEGGAYEVTITEIAHRSARCSIHRRHHRLHEPDVKLTLGVGILKNASNFDFLVEKTTELGVTTIVPLQTERTIPHHAKAERWQKIALSAMKQSGRSVLPLVTPLTRLAEFLERKTDAELQLLPYEHIEVPSLAQVVRSQHVSSAAVCIGPEGGFSEQEVAMARAAGFRPVSLGPRRLRTETAAIVATAVLMS